MTNLSPELIKKLKKDSGFQEFLSYIVEIIEQMDNLGGFDTKVKNEQLGEQLRARVIARDKLYEILRPLVEHRERKKRTTEEIDKAKSKYGI